MKKYLIIKKIKVRFLLIGLIIICILVKGTAQFQDLPSSNSNEKLPEIFSLILSFDTSYSGRVIIFYNKEKGKSNFDTAYIKDNKCLFTGTVTEPALLYIEFPDMPSPLNEFYRVLILTKGFQKMDFDSNRLYDSFIQGNINDSAYLDYRNSIKNLEKKIQTFEQMDSNDWKNGAFEDSISNLKDSILKEGIRKIKKYNDYWVSAYILFSLKYNLSPEAIKELYTNLPDKIKCSTFGIEVSNTVQRQVGNIAPDFFAISSTENNIHFSKISGSSKLTLLYFWATWCVPCKVLLPHLDTLQKKYGRNGLSIIAVANDDERRTTWLNAIQSLKIDYMTHVLQRFGKEDDIGRLFATMAIPVVILVDNHGKIIYRVLGTEIEPMKDFIEIYFQNID
jgi:thiol-disulfide isomerase/thioredoxin